MKKNNKPSQRDRFVQQIVEKILSGEWAIGDRLPTERDLSELMNVSRSIVNAGMVELASKGFIKIVPRKWTEVMDYRKNGTIAVLESIMHYSEEDIDQDILVSILSSRLLIEKECAYLAAQNRKDEDLIMLSSIIEKEEILKQDPSDHLHDIIQLDFSFHHAIAVASNHIVYALIIKSFEPLATRLIHRFYSHKHVLDYVLTYHKKIYQAIKNNDSDTAQKLMEEMLIHGERTIKQNFEQM